MGVISYFVVKPKWLSYGLGLAGTIISLQIDVIYRLERNSRLLDSIERVRWLRPLVERMANSLTRIAGGDRLQAFADAARSELERCVAVLEGQASGRFQAPVGENILERQTDLARQEILAVSIQSLDIPRWNNELGRKYWAANLRAIERGVRVERVFVFDEWNSEIEALTAQQATAGVNVSVVSREATPPQLRIDMAVWDRSFTYQFELNSEGEPISNEYSVNEVDIERRVQQFSILRSLGKKIEPRNRSGEA
ncbi:MAG: hypothetical protein M3323_00610 [Actinomycetota bacterium]|nr:hypothetical protein [Actinomycetota bacterium]